MRLSLVTHLCLLLRGTVNTRRAGIIVRNESMWVSSHLVLTWNLRKTCHMDTLGKPCSSCQPFCLVPGLPPCATIPVPIKSGCIFRWDVLGRGKTAIPAPKGSWANRGPISLLIATFCTDLLI